MPFTRQKCNRVYFSTVCTLLIVQLAWKVAAYLDPVTYALFFSHEMLHVPHQVFSLFRCEGAAIDETLETKKSCGLSSLVSASLAGNASLNTNTQARARGAAIDETLENKNNCGLVSRHRLHRYKRLSQHEHPSIGIARAVRCYTCTGVQHLAFFDTLEAFQQAAY